MTIEAFRMQNFMGFEDSGWIELRPITLLFGRNSVGKSAILRALLLLRQSLNSPSDKGPFLFVKDNEFDFGDFRDLVRGHRTERPISFWFQCRLEDQKDDRWHAKHALQELGADGEVIRARLTYRQPPQKKVQVLCAIDLYDQSGSLILQATAPALSGAERRSWVFSSEFFDPYDERNYDLWSSLELFTSSGFLPWIRTVEGSLAISDPDDPNAVSAFGETFHQLFHLLHGFRSSIGSTLESLEYLGPLREEPQRFYYVSGQAHGLAQRGKHFVRSLLNTDPTLIGNVDDWLSDSGFGVRLELKPLDSKKTLYELRLAETGRFGDKRFSAGIREVGFGLSQALPVIVQTMLAPEGSTILIEQPELHLHPGAQAELGDLFMQATAGRGIRLLVETHSEHLILRLQRRIRMRSLVPDVINVSFVTKNAGLSTCHHLRMDREGDFIDEWPEGFFNERYSEIFGGDDSKLRALNKTRK